MWDNLSEAVRDVEKFGNFSNVSISIWWYKEYEKKFYGNGGKRRFLRNGAKYESAITDRLFFDIDCVNKEGKINYDILVAYRNLLHWAISKNLRRQITFTGGGFQVLIAVNTNPANYENVYYNLKDKFKIIDKEYATLEKMRRVPGSYNFGKDKKSERNLYCICLTDNEALLPFTDIQKIASVPRNEIIWMGEHVYKPTNIKRKPKKLTLKRDSNFTIDNSVNDILQVYGWKYNDICKNIRAIIEQEHVCHRERMSIIKYLKTIMGIKYADVIIILPKILTSLHGNTTDGYHSIEEGQPDSVYTRNMQFDPEFMIDNGYCTHGCIKCINFINGSK